MSSGQLLIVLAVCAATLGAVAALARVGVPAPVVLVLAGLVIGFLPFVPDASLRPDVVLLGLLPLLVYDAAATSSPTAFLRDARSIGVLAVALVAVTAVAVAAVGHYLGHLSWPIAFVLGTAVGPTDAAAATSVARRIRLPRRLISTLEGEALFNDATALVFYAAAVAVATTGHLSPLHVAASVVFAAAAGTAIGLATAVIGRILCARIDDPPVEIAASILLAYAAYLPAEAIGASGVLAAVAAGLYLGWQGSGGGARSARVRLQSAAFWQTLVFLVNALLFVFVGLSFHSFSVHARGPLGSLALAALAVVATVVVLRLVCMWAFRPLMGPGRSGGEAAGAAAWRERLILGWSGMRGAITMAALLAVPKLTATGVPLRGRDDIIYLGFAVILATLLAQGMTLPLLVRRLAPSEHPSVALAERQARLELTNATLRHLERVDAAGELPDELTDAVRAQYLARLRHLEADAGNQADADTVLGASAAAEIALRRDVNALQRRTLSELLGRGEIGLTTLRTLQRELDLHEAAMASAPAPVREIGPRVTA